MKTEKTAKACDSIIIKNIENGTEKEKRERRAGRPRREDGRNQRSSRAGQQGLSEDGSGKGGNPKTAPAKAEHSQDFLRFDRHGDMVDNFFRNFYRQCKEPTRFGFYRVAADMADAVLPVIKDLLKDPAANAEMLAAHKVDTSEYRKQAETENVKQESDNEPLKKTEEMEQKKEEQKQEVQQPQTAEAQDEQQPQKQEKRRT